MPIAESSVQFVFAGTRAQAVYYRSRSLFFGQRYFGVSGNVLPSAPNSVFYGARPTTIALLVQQTSIAGADLLYPKDSGVVANANGYGSYLVLTEPGASVNSSSYFLPLDSDEQAAGSGSGSSSQPLGVTVNVAIQVGSGSTLLSVSEKDPDGVLLVSSICAFLSGLFALSRGLLVLIEESFITVKRTQQKAQRRAEESFAVEIARVPTRDRESTAKGTKAAGGSSSPHSETETEPPEGKADGVAAEPSPGAEAAASPEEADGNGHES